MSDQHTPFFVVGAPRSGTTLLRLMLNAHPRLAVPPESHFITLLHKRFRGQFDVEPIWASLRTRDRFIAWDLDPADVEQALRHRSPNDWSTFFDVVFDVYAEKWNKPRWGDKTPGYVMHLPLLDAVFAGMKVIHIVRDPRDVVASLLHMPWASNDLADLALGWRRRVMTGHGQGSRVLGNRYAEVRYEQLVSHPEAELRRLCKHLGEPFDPAMLQYHQTTERMLPPSHMPFHQNTREPVNAQSVARGLRELSSRQIATVDFVCGETMDLYGYERRSNRRVGPLLDLGVSRMRRWRTKTPYRVYATARRAAGRFTRHG